VRAQQGFFTIERTCPNCRGQGRVVRNPCKACSGAGRVQKERTLSIDIPPGVEEGTRIRLSGEGQAGVSGGPTGDLYVFLSVKPHPIFQRDGHDLHCRVPIGFVTATLGGTIECRHSIAEARACKFLKARNRAGSSGCATRACQC
jgi:molecular chaperone DnaJ